MIVVANLNKMMNIEDDNALVPCYETINGDSIFRISNSL